MWIEDRDVLAMAEAARWAPSVHNTQPWRFVARADGLDVVVDDSRALPVLDPTGRLRTVSCGAAVGAAAVAATARGYGTQVRLLPHGPRGRLVARVTCTSRRTPTAGDLRLADAVPRRRTHRALRPGEPVPPDVLDELAETVADEGVALTVLGRPQRRMLAEMLEHAVVDQHARPEVLAETTSWLREGGRGRARPEDGILRGSLGTWPFPVASVVREQSPPPADLLLRLDDDVLDTTVVVLSTRTDTRRDHLVTGVALERMLLHATALDLAVAFADVATQVRDTRSDLGALLGRRGAAQVVLRLGRALVDVRVPPRRQLTDLLDTSDAPEVVDLTSYDPTRTPTPAPYRTGERTHERTAR